MSVPVFAGILHQTTVNCFEQTIAENGVMSPIVATSNLGDLRITNISMIETITANLGTMSEASTRSVKGKILRFLIKRW